MAKKAKKGNGKAKAAAKPSPAKQDAAKAKPARQARDLDALRKPVVAARAKFEAISDEAKEQVKKAVDAMSQAAREYHQALAPYREACRKAGVECEFEGGRTANVSPKVSFIVEKTEKGIRVAVKGKPGTEELIPLAALKAGVGKAAYAYTDKHVGPRDKVGNKGGTLANRLRAVMAGKK
jgi:hypothetical protein